MIMTVINSSRRPLRAALVLALAVCWLPAQSKPAAGDKPLPEKIVLRTTAAFLEHAHLLEHPLDDEISHRAFKLLMEGLDPYKLYFDKSDLEAFEARRDDIDDMVKSGDASFARFVFKRFRQRIDERVKLIEELLAGSFDFTRDEVFLTETEDRHWLASPEEFKDEWRKRLKSNLLGLEADGTTGKEAHQRLLKRYRRFRDRIHELTEEEIFSRFINSVTNSYDPHTTYFAPKPFEDFEIDLTLNYQGIGAYLQEDEDGAILIQRVIPGGAADKQGQLRAKDKIIGVGQGKEGPIVDVVGMRLRDVVKLIRGPEGTAVRLKIVPAAGGPVRTYTLIRAKIRLEERKAKGRVIEEGQGPNGKPWKVGVVDLPSFYMDTNAKENGDKDFTSSTRDVREILEGFEKQSVNAVVLDLRRNGGGFLPEAVGVSGLFIDKGTVVQVKGNGRRIRRLNDREAGMAWKGPLVVLISRASASASEIVAGAIKDYGRGLIVGDPTTHGKGTVQSPIDLAERIDYPDGRGSLGMLKLTLQQFYRPDGESTQLEGVPSDISLPTFTSVMDIGEADLPYALPFDRIVPTEHEDYGLARPEVISDLRRRSLQRRRDSSFFQGLERRIQAYLRFKQKRGIPLQRKEYEATQKAMNEEETVREKMSGPEAGKPEEKSKTDEELDPWFKEVVAIAIDYVQALRGTRN